MRKSLSFPSLPLIFLVGGILSLLLACAGPRQEVNLASSPAEEIPETFASNALKDTLPEPLSLRESWINYRYALEAMDNGEWLLSAHYLDLALKHLVNERKDSTLRSPADSLYNSSFLARILKASDEVYPQLSDLGENAETWSPYEISLEGLEDDGEKADSASFSNNVYGDAYGELNFVVNKDSLYFDGDVMVREGFLNIAPLNTVYKLENQKITLNPQGIFFDNIRLRDKDYNLAFLDGAVYHNKFRDFRLNLHINSDRIMALNTPKTTDVSFCGDGYVSGNIFIVGDTKKLRFYGDDLKTLSGSQLIFPVSSASKVSTSDGIRFKASLNEAQVVPTKRQSSTEMDYDFTFDVTQDANVRIDLDVIDGTLACKTNGKLRLTYNSTKSLNLDGMLTVASGSFNMSLRNLVPREFDIVEGGTINFTGPLSSSIVDVTARYVKNTSLNNISNQLNIGRTEVNAFLNLDGSLLNPQPSFSFSFPKLNSEEQANVYAALDTSNTQNVLRQFFSLVFFNSFVAGEAQTGSLETQGLQGGIGMVADLFNNFLSQQFKNFDLGLNYYSSDANYREYSVNASIPLYNDRILVKTRFGLAENVSAGTSGNNNNLVGDVSFEYKINEAGNWVLRLFYFNDQYELNQDASRPQQGGGVALIFQQEFNGKQDLIEAWRLHAFGPSRKSKKGKNYEY